MRVALASASQLESLVDLLCEVNRHYNPTSPASREVVHEHVTQNLLPAASPHRLVVASRHDGTVFGLAAVTLVYSFVEPELERRRQCQLKELFVSASERGQGVGRALMEWVARYALENGCHRIDWPVKASNAMGIKFYESLGAKLVEDRLGYRLSEPTVSTLAVQRGGVARGA